MSDRPGNDSRADTYEHIHHVQQRLAWVLRNLQDRMLWHDASKLRDPEKEAFDVYSPKLASLVYGTDEYRATLREMKPALEHHYAMNSHHPEHYPDGIQGMSLLDLVEMLCDWSAAGLRHKNNAGVAHSIELNQKRFGYSDELKAILLNTAALVEGAGLTP